MAELATQANRLGISQQQCTSYLVVEVPDTVWGLAYQTYASMCGIDDMVGVMVVSIEQFESGGTSVDRLRKFSRAMVLTGRPCHLARAYGQIPTADEN